MLVVTQVVMVGDRTKGEADRAEGEEEGEEGAVGVVGPDMVVKEIMEGIMRIGGIE